MIMFLKRLTVFLLFTLGVGACVAQIEHEVRLTHGADDSAGGGAAYIPTTSPLLAHPPSRIAHSNEITIRYFTDFSLGVALADSVKPLLLNRDIDAAEQIQSSRYLATKDSEN